VGRHRHVLVRAGRQRRTDRGEHEDHPDQLRQADHAGRIRRAGGQANPGARLAAGFITGIKGFGGLGTFFWEPEGYPSFNNYNSSAWDEASRRPTAAMDGFLNV
jgi:hypothetical protein